MQPVAVAVDRLGAVAAAAGHPCHPNHHATTSFNQVLIVAVMPHDVSDVGVERTLQARLSAIRTALHPQHGLLGLHRPLVDWLALHDLLHQHLRLRTFPLAIIELTFHFRHRP